LESRLEVLGPTKFARSFLTQNKTSNKIFFVYFNNIPLAKEVILGVVACNTPPKRYRKKKKRT
jgi:hypothetical protein